MSFDLEIYRKISRDRIINALLVADYGTITERLMGGENRGEKNKVWETGPTISSGANRPDTILNNIPYTIKLSEHSAGLFDEFSKDTPLNIRGGKEFKFDEISAEELLATLSIPVLFAILEHFEFQSYEQRLADGGILTLDNHGITLSELEAKRIKVITAGRIKHYLYKYKQQSIQKRVETWAKFGLKPLSQEVIEQYVKLGKRRNTFVHEVDFILPTMVEAIEYFRSCNEIAELIEAHLNK